MSLDGFVAGPSQSEENPLGEGGEQLHEWVVRLEAWRRPHGIESALEQAREAAGDRDVALGGGANVAQQYPRAGPIDEMQLHVVPVLLGAGARLFDNLEDANIELECTSVVEAPGVTHLTYRILK
jgi:dihydrofolate reductase